MSIIKKYQFIHYLGAASTGILALLLLLTITPNIFDNVQAEEIPVSLDVEDYINVALTGTENATMEIKPLKDGSFIESGDIRLNITSNNPTGYRLTMATSDDSSALVNSTGDIIESITTSTDQDNFPLNSWGYKISIADLTTSFYSAIPRSGTVLDDNREQESRAYIFNFAARVDASKSGTYTNAIIVSAIANPLTITNLNDLTYMQDMTHSICANTVTRTASQEPITKQLIDSRDGKKYWVSKLADGNCWMVQNLALDIDAKKGLKATDTDIANDWNASSTYPPATTWSTTKFDLESNYTTAYSWNLGEYVLKDPTSGQGCSDILNGANIETCEHIEKYNGTQDTHFLLGNYYQWNTATASSGVNIKSANAPHSICPKNWQLPENSTSKHDLENLLSKYNLTNSSTVTAAANKTPYIIFTGFLHINPGSKILNIGNGLGYWSKTAGAKTTDVVYSYLTSTGNYYPVLENNLRHTGNSIRCLAR